MKSHLRIVFAIALKDLKAATRDGRILLGLLMPLGLGVLYNVVMPDAQKPSVTVAVATADATRLPVLLRGAAGGNVNITILNVSTAAEVRDRINAKKADVGVVVPAGFDAAVGAGATPTLVVMSPASGATYGANYVVASLDSVLRQMAGQHPPASIAVQTTQPSGTDFASIVNQLGVRKYLVLGTLIMLIAMIAIYILPVLLTEEYEKKTADALLMIGSQTDIVVGKALVGVAYTAISVPMLVLVTRMTIGNPLLFAAAVTALTVTLIGFGLLLGGLVRTVAQLNTWSSIPLLVLIMPVFLVALGLPSWIQLILDTTPGSQAARLIVDSLSAQPVYGSWPVAFALLGAWAVAGYGLLIRTLARRES